MTEPDTSRDAGQYRDGPSSKRQPQGSSLPALWAFTAVMAGSAALFWLYLARGGQPSGPDPARPSTLATVDVRDLGQAMTTMTDSNGALAALRMRRGKCAPPLAWISVARADGAVPATIRIKSGSYFSPAVALASAPVRIAIPYPAPYASGHGVLAVVGSGGPALLSLSPPWVASPQGGVATHAVAWLAAQSCPETQE
jgi:hypothetical protein